MTTLARHLDDLLRGRKTSTDLLAAGRVELPLRTYLLLAVALGATYGFFMGWYAVGDRAGWMQLIASAVKLPALFLLTLAVTFPSMYVFNALVGCRLTFLSALRLMVAGIVVSLAVAASFGPILAFFTLSTTSYGFMVLLNVALLGVAGIVGLGFLLRALRVLARRPDAPLPASDAPTPPTEPAPGEGPRPGRAAEAAAANTIFQIWVLIYGIVGAQMGWILRPFIGSPDMPFQWFRPQQGNFLLGVYWALRRLFDL